MQTLNYKPNTVARKLATGKNDIFGLVLLNENGKIINWDLIELVKQVCNFFSENGLSLFIFTSNSCVELFIEVTEYLKKNEMKALIFIEPFVTEKLVSNISSYSIPYNVFNLTGINISDTKRINNELNNFLKKLTKTKNDSYFIFC